MLRKAPIIAALLAAFAAFPAGSATTHRELRTDVHWSFENPIFGRYDQAQLQRGYRVYREICSSCHSMNLLSFRNLGDAGGPFWDPRFPNPNDNPVVKTIAHDFQIADIDPDTGDPNRRPGTPADRFPAPFANEAAARASNNGAVPPDLSVMARAREGGPRYIYSILTGYTNPPPGLTVGANQHYNPYMPGDMSSYWHGSGPPPEGGFIAMPPPLAPQGGQVQFDDRTPSTQSNEARDVAAFLMWSADPHMEERKQAGLAVLIFLVLFAGLVYASYRKIWENVAH
jgi:ubiquinol-cytochrome c reductase cytochrome c1 subunit